MLICQSHDLISRLCRLWFFFFNDTATTEIYTLSLHDALPISQVGVNMILGALTGKRLPIDQLEAFHSAQKLATDGEFDSAAKILDPVLRANPKAQMEVAKAAHRADVVAGMPAIGKVAVEDLVLEGPAGTIKSAKVIADADIAHSKARWEAVGDRKSTRLNSSHTDIYRMPSSA